LGAVGWGVIIPKIAPLDWSPQRTS
jgi:hypothetical protein